MYKVVYKQTKDGKWITFHTTVFGDVAREIETSLSRSGLVSYTGIDHGGEIISITETNRTEGSYL